MPNKDTLENLKSALSKVDRDLKKPIEEDVPEPKPSKRYSYKKPIKKVVSNTILGLVIGLTGIGGFLLGKYFSPEPSVKSKTEIVETIEDDSLQKDLEEVLSQNTELIQKNEQYETRVQELSTQSAEQNTELERVGQENKQLSTQNTELMQENEQYETSVQELTAEADRQRAKAERLTQERGQAVAAKEAAETERDQATGRLRKYEELGPIETIREIVGSENIVDMIAADRARLNEYEELGPVETIREVIESENAADIIVEYQTRLNEYEEEKVRLKTELVARGGNNYKLEKQLDQATEQVVSYRTRLEQIQAELKQSTAEVMRLKQAEVERLNDEERRLRQEGYQTVQRAEAAETEETESKEIKTIQDIAEEIGIDEGALRFLLDNTDPAQNAELRQGNNRNIHLLLTLGNGGETSASSYAFGSDWTNRKMIYTGGIAVIQNGGQPWDQDPNYSWSNEIEFYLGAGARLNRDLFILGTIGHSFFDVNKTSSTYFERKEYTTLSAELRYTYKHLVIGVGHHNRRGFLFGIGYGF